MLVENYEYFLNFVHRHLNPHKKDGFLLTIGIGITFFFLFIFFGILQDYIGHDPLVQADVRIVTLVRFFRSDALNGVMLFVSNLGKWQIIFFGVIAVGFPLFALNVLPYLFALVISAGGGEVIVWIIKNLVQRPRPSSITALLFEKGFSFPSGHSFMAVSFYGVLAYVVFRMSRKRTTKILSVIGGAGIMGAIGFSRIYLGVHWPSDVLASFALGAALLTAVITFLEIRQKSVLGKGNASLIGKRFILIPSISLFVVWLLYMGYFLNHHPFAPQIEPTENPIFISEKEIPGNLFSHLPHASETITGLPMEPINIILAGSYKEVSHVFELAGWVSPDPINIKNGWRHTIASILDEPYPKALETPSLWNGKVDDFAYQLPMQTIRQRYHVHFWSTPFVTDRNRTVWVGTAHFDQSITLKTIFPTHKIDPYVDNARNKIKDDLLETGEVESVEEFQITDVRQGKNQAGNLFVTDGKAIVLFLK